MCKMRGISLLYTLTALIYSFSSPGKCTCTYHFPSLLKQVLTIKGCLCIRPLCWYNDLNLTVQSVYLHTCLVSFSTETEAGFATIRLCKVGKVDMLFLSTNTSTTVVAYPNPLFWMASRIFKADFMLYWIYRHVWLTLPAVNSSE